ncbi:hypothetical protein EDC04DRAFT_2908513 [Pisolithus marmoratus]|nr:hypothetical protein EDC04DRAFT_2908513 [Pisolithus marmoratus]
MEPELAEDGCNWHTYGSWVLKAISEDGLMGHIDGSETRPTTPKLLQEYGAGQTPRTNEERDVVAAWKTADDTWHQRAAMAHQYIIFSLPDSILMLCMHLDTPGEAFAYLESRYGSIPRPESLKIVDEASRQCNLPSKQCATAESTQNIFDSHHEPENPPSSEEGSPDSPNDCAETESEYLTPEIEVVDVQQVEDNLPEVEVGAVDVEQPNECTNAPEAPDKSSQCIQDDADATRRDLPDTTSKRAETKTGQTKPEAKVVDTQQVVDILSMFEDGNADQERLEHASTLEAPDERSQHTANEVAERRNLPMWSPEACEPAGDTAKRTSKRSIGFTPKTYLGQDQSLPTSGKTILDVPGPPPPDARIKCPIPQDNPL